MDLQPMKWGRHTLVFDRTLIIGILNVTPDSFSDGGQFIDPAAAVGKALKMIEEGADIIDIGGESTRPGSEEVSEKEELRRVLPVIKALCGKTKMPISIDTMKPSVADACLLAGASMLNDVTGLQNPDMIKIAAKHKIPVIIMHMQGMPKTMQKDPRYKDVISDIKKFFKSQVRQAKKNGVGNIILDPGIGFGKTTHHNLQIIKRLDEFKDIGCPLLIGPSRKSFIGNITGLPATERLEGTLASISIGIMNGAHMIRVHDVKEAKRAAMVADALRTS